MALDMADEGLAEARALMAEMSRRQREAAVRQVVSADEDAMLRASNG